MRRVRGQSMVEMAFLLPLLLSLVFGIIDMGWYVYGFATLTQAARNGAEVAAQLPPFEASLNTRDTGNPALYTGDPCTQTIRQTIQQDAVMFDLLSDITVVTISYPNAALATKRDRGNPIQVQVTYQLVPLTPLFQWLPLGNNGRFTISASSIRSIESLGNTPPTATNPSGVACK